jgi:hypothetical protein
VKASVGTTTLDPLLALRDAIDRADAELYTQKKRTRQPGRRSTPVDIDAVAEPE